MIVFFINKLKRRKETVKNCVEKTIVFFIEPEIKDMTMFYNHLRKVLLMAGIFVLPSLPAAAEIMPVSDFAGLSNRDYYIGGGVALEGNITVPSDNTAPIYVDHYNSTIMESELNGNGHTVSGNGTATFWHLISTNHLAMSIHDLTLTNFVHTSGLLNVSGSELHMDNVTVDGMTGGNDPLYGGVINAQGESTVFIANSVFENVNILSNQTGTDAVSGGIINVQGAGDFDGTGTGVGQSEISAIENSTFQNNSVASSGTSAYGGVIASEGNIGNISESRFITNILSATNGHNAYGGAIANGSANGADRGVAKIAGIENTTFRDNHVQTDNGTAMGGAIWNEEGNVIGDITGSTFSGNTASSQTGASYGGAIYNGGTIENITNSTFENNSAGTLGGAVYSTQDLTLSADNGNTAFSGNTDQSGANDIYMAGADENAPVTLNLQTNNGFISFAGGIAGENYNIFLTGTDTSGQNDNEAVYVNGMVDGVGTMTLNGGSKLWLGKDGIMNVQNMLAPAGSVAFLKVDVEVSSADNQVAAGMINVANDVSGTYKVIVNPLNNEHLANNEDSLVAFLSAPNDDIGTETSVEVSRVIGSTNMWKALLNAGGDESGSVWYLSQTDEAPAPGPDPDPDPDPSVPVVTEKAPEVIAAMALPSAAIEQTRDLLRTVSGKSAAARSYCRGCGVYPDAWDSRKLNNGWVVVGARSADIDKPFDTDADIWSVEAGFDFQKDANNSLGVFASYRQGEYDFSGQGSKYFSAIGSELDIDSYLGGLYYRYDKNAWWLFASVYGGIQKADASTDDHLASFDTDGTEFGGGIEGGRIFDMGSWALTPSLGVFYTEIDFDSANDDLGKKYSWDKIRHLEAEAGVKVEKNFELGGGLAGVYVRPSVVQTLTNDSEAKVVGVMDSSKADGYHDQTLGRLEIGGKYFWDNGLSAYGWANYTFGSSYDAAAFGLGLNYAF